MNRFPDYEQDYAFGQLMLTLRTSIGLTQSGLAEYLGVSRRAVGEWEAGNSYPKAERLKNFITLAAKEHAFTSGTEGEEVRALWRAARQRVLLDEAWLATLLAGPAAQHQQQPVPVDRPEQSERLAGAVAHVSPSPAIPKKPQTSWDGAPASHSFYGRKWELEMAKEWVVEERCRVVSVLGMGGIGKSVLSVNVMHQIAEHFDVVIWRSLRDAPSCEALLDDCLQVLAPEALGESPASDTLEIRINLLLKYLRSMRALLVWDNMESVLDQGEKTGHMRAGYEVYGRLLRRVAETEHQSCLLLTSREKLEDLVLLEGNHSPVRVLHLARLGTAACEQLLTKRGVEGTAHDRSQLIEAYAGNPLALKIVAQTIVDLFDGDISSFLKQGATIYGGVRELIDEQFNRLSTIQQDIMFWLAIARAPCTLDELLLLFATPVPRVWLLEGVEALQRHSLVEPVAAGATYGAGATRHIGFTLQSVVLEYVTERLVTEASSEIEESRPLRLIGHGFVLAQAPEYIRQAQERLIATPILERLRGSYHQQAQVEVTLSALLARLSTLAAEAQGYGPANLVALLRLQRGNLRGLNLSGLALRGAYLQNVEMQDATLAGTSIRNSTFTETFDAVVSVAVSGDGKFLAACGVQGDIRFWSADDYTLQQIWNDPEALLFNFALSPDGRRLAAATSGGTVKLWDITTRALLWSSDVHSGPVNVMLFTPDGRAIATCADDATVRLCDVETGKLLQILEHPAVPYHVAIPAIALTWDGGLLASSDTEGRIYLWALNGRESATLVRTIAEHTKVVTGLAFAPNGDTLASASRDGTIKLWSVPGGELLQTLPGDRGPLSRVAWSPDSGTLACGGEDNMIWLWDVADASYHAVLRGHTGRIRALAFTPDGLGLFSGSADGTLRLWEPAHARCVRVLQGYTLFVHNIRWRPDSKQIVSSSSDMVLTIYDLAGAAPPHLLRGHTRLIRGLTWSPDGLKIASSEMANVIRVWDANSGACVEVLQTPDDPTNIFYGLAWRSDGQDDQWLASTTRKHGIILWDMATAPEKGTPGWHRFRQIDSESYDLGWSPDGTGLASADADSYVSVWSASANVLRHRLGPHPKPIFALIWSPSGRLLLLCCDGGEQGAFFVWDVQEERIVRNVAGPVGIAVTADWGTNDEVVVSGSSDGRLYWWDIKSGDCILTREAHQGTVQHIVRSPDGTRLASCGSDGAIMLWDLQSGEYIQTLRRERPYERLDITGIRGLTEAQKATLIALGALERG